MKTTTHLCVSLEHRFYRFNGVIYTKLAFGENYWRDYLEYFDKVYVIARVKEVSEIDDSFRSIELVNVVFLDVPYFKGLKEFVWVLPKLFFSIHSKTSNCDRFLLRSGNVTNLVWISLILRRKKYIREFPGNIEQGVIGVAGASVAVRLIAKFLHKIAKIQAKGAEANAYVSEYCKGLYPSDKPTFIFSSFNASEVIVKKTNYIMNNKLKMICIGRLEGEKGVQDLIELISKIPFQVSLTVVGDGSLKALLEDRAQELNVDVDFVGTILNRLELFSMMADSDLYVIPSHTEGMPRALLEAMAVGLPCIGTNVGGIPEVLPKELLFSYSDDTKFLSLVTKMMESEAYRRDAGIRNLNFVNDRFSSSAMSTKKHEFWSYS